MLGISSYVRLFLFNICLLQLSLTTTMATRHPTHSLFRFLLVSNSLDLILDILLKLWTTAAGKIVTFSYVPVLISCYAAQVLCLLMVSKKFYLPLPPMHRKQRTELITGLLLFLLLISPLLKPIYFKAGIPEGVTNALEDNFFASCIINR